MGKLIRRILPRFMLDRLISIKASLRDLLIKILNAYGFNLSRKDDYYSSLPSLDNLKKNKKRWFKPSQLAGVRYDLEAMKNLLARLATRYYNEYGKLPDYNTNLGKRYGPGYPEFDCLILYFMVRNFKPKRFIEVGSGLSTYYCSLAVRKNREEGYPCQITCIDPFSFEALREVGGINMVGKEVQDIEPAFFGQLEAGDMLFIDSTHIVKIDGDVPYLLLEIVPRLKNGVLIHFHDVPFPYNVPYPPDVWIFGQAWPFFWNEAMLLQAFLAYNDAYRILFSSALLRFYDDDFFWRYIPGYRLLKNDNNPFSSIWIKRVEDGENQKVI